MKFTSITIDNFGAVKHAEVALSDRGLVLIQGENRDDPSANSNGAGKSTIVEALCWALYGKTAKGVAGDGVVNRKAGKGTKVIVSVEDGDQFYQIVRHRKHPKGKNGLEVWRRGSGGLLVAHTKGTDKLTQDLVDRIMGCTYDVFVAAVYAGQEALPDMPGMTDKALKLLIEEAAGITLLNDAYDIARRHTAVAVEKVNETASQFGLQKITTDSAISRLEDAIESEKRWYAERDARVIDLDTEARIYITDARSQQKTLADRASKGEVQSQIDKISDKLAGVKSENAELDRLQSISTAAERKASALKATAQNCVERTQKYKQNVTTTRAGIGKPCTECGRPHDGKTLECAITGAVVSAEDSERIAREAIDAAKSARSDAESAAESVGAFKRTMTALDEISAVNASLTRSLTEIEGIEANIARVTTLAKKRVEAVKAEKAAKNPYSERMVDLELAVSKSADKVKALEVRLTTEQIDVKTAQDAARVYSPKGVRAHILDTVTPYLNERTAHYLGSLADGRIEAIWQTLTPSAKGELREKFSIGVTHADGGDEFAALSGGEKRKVRLSCAMALQDLVATRATKPIGLWIADEVDAALDVSGLERLMGVLEDKARERGTVLVISHSDLTDWCRNTITVVKEGGSSSVE